MCSSVELVANLSSFTLRLTDNEHIQPIPLECLGLGSFKDEPASRRDDSGSGRLLTSMMKPSRPAYPFTVFHRLDVKRRYTFYSERETLRTKWHDILVDAMAVRQTERDVNKWYAPETIDDGTFVSRTAAVPSSTKAYFSGRITGSATWGKIAQSDFATIKVANFKPIYVNSKS